MTKIKMKVGVAAVLAVSVVGAGAPVAARAATHYGPLLQQAKAGSARAVQKILHGAQIGNAVAESCVGILYYLGQGVPRNFVKAAYWFRKAAAQGNADAETGLGAMYYFGRGVPRNFVKAVYWQKKAAAQGNADAETGLGIDYNDGQGVPQNYVKAAYWWRKAAEQGNIFAKHNLAALKEQEASPLRIFGVGLKGARRPQLEAALTAAGLTPHNGQVGPRWWFDAYNVNGRLKGATRLLVGYTSHSRFALAQYTFPGFMDPGLVRRIIDMAQTKYGKPTSIHGNFGLGAVTATWNVGDGMAVEVTRGWPNTTTYLKLIDVLARARMKLEMRHQKEQQRAAQAKRESNAF